MAETTPWTDEAIAVDKLGKRSFGWDLTLPAASSWHDNGWFILISGDVGLYQEQSDAWVKIIGGIDMGLIFALG
jgi:hypothetical protein